MDPARSAALRRRLGPVDIDGLLIDDSLGTYEIRRGGLVVGDMTWCWNPNDRTRFGWLLHVMDASDDNVLVVLRVGDQGREDALWASRNDLAGWNERADATRIATADVALLEAVRILNTPVNP
jgi:hypothetical protein